MAAAQESNSTTHLAYEEIYAEAGKGITELNAAVWRSVVKHWLQRLLPDVQNPLISDLGAGEGHLFSVIETALENVDYVGYEYAAQAITNATEFFGDRIRMEYADVLNLSPEQKLELAKSDMILELFIGPSVGFENVLQVVLEIRQLATEHGWTPPKAILIDRIYSEDNLETSDNLLVQMWYLLMLLAYGVKNGFIYSPDFQRIAELMERNIFEHQAYRAHDDEHAANATGPKHALKQKIENLLQQANIPFDLGTPGENIILVLK